MCHSDIKKGKQKHWVYMLWMAEKSTLVKNCSGKDASWRQHRTLQSLIQIIIHITFEGKSCKKTEQGASSLILDLAKLYYKCTANPKISHVRFIFGQAVTSDPILLQRARFGISCWQEKKNMDKHKYDSIHSIPKSPQDKHGR